MNRPTKAKPRIHWRRFPAAPPTGNAYRSCQTHGSARQHHLDDSDPRNATCELCMTDARKAGLLKRERAEMRTINRRQGDHSRGMDLTQ